MKTLIPSLLVLVTMPLMACNNSKPVSEQIQAVESTDATPVSLGLFVTKTPTGNLLASSSVIRSRSITVDTASLLKRLSAEQVMTLPLNFFDNAVFHVVRQKQMLNQSGSITWLGRLPSIAGSIAILNITENTIYGSLDIPNKGLFSIRGMQDGSHLVEEIDRSAIQ